MPPFFSVIIPAYNCAHLISETLNSALSQEFPDYEIIVVNDGSTDNTAEVLDSFHSKFEQSIRVICQENKGEGGARNAGIFAARGQYLAFLDQDDLWFPWTLKTYFRVLTKYGFPSFLVGSGHEFTTEISRDIFRETSISEKYFEDFFSLAHYPYLPTGTPGTIVRSDEARRVGGLSEVRVVGIDQEFYYKLGDAKGLVFVSSPLTVAIRRHSGNLQKNTVMAAEGALFFIDNEINNKYPGGSARRWDRRALMTRYLRTISRQCLGTEFSKCGWKIYKKTFAWHVHLARVRYIIFFPVIYLYKLPVRMKLV